MQEINIDIDHVNYSEKTIENGLGGIFISSDVIVFLWIEDSVMSNDTAELGAVLFLIM